MRDLEKRLSRLESEVTPTACNCVVNMLLAFRHPGQSDQEFETSLTPEYRTARGTVCPVHGETLRVRLIEFVKPRGDRMF